MANYETFGQHIKARREQLELTIADAAAQAGLPVTMWTDMEENDVYPTLKMLRPIGHVLNLNPEKVL